ncbi:MAG: DEAD/DEAH box helicase [Victivallaceae bacterium]|nr:DEAD/DEAH box helicase [Victivallaceae bacterium]
MMDETDFPVDDFAADFDIADCEVEYEVDKRPDISTLEEGCRTFFSPGGPLQSAMPDGEERPQQLEMALAISRALAKGANCCIEAPTGVGKSFAYLVPLFERARLAGRCALITTETIHLQEQLIEKDIPFLSEVMGIPIKAALAKGRRNYLCRRRFALLTGEQRDALLPLPSLVGDVARITSALENGAGGERDDPDFRVDPATWDLVCCEVGNCLGGKCEFFRECAYMRARRKWEEADIVVANHALFFTDLAMRCGEGTAGTLLPNYGAVLIDEAHTLEDNAADHLGLHISKAGVLHALNKLYNPENVRGLLVRNGINPALRAAVASCRDEAYGWFAPYENLLQQCHESALAVNRPIQDSPNFQTQLSALIEDLSVAVEREEEPGYRTELESAVNRCREIIDAVDAFRTRKLPDTVYYAENERAQISLHGTPLNIAEALGEILFNQDFPVILCSATLTVRKHFDYYFSRSGFTNGESLRLDSPFAADQARFRAVRRFPDPSTPEFTDALIGILPELIAETDGKSFVLFTSYQQMRRCADALRDEFAGRNWQLLVQGGELSRYQMLREFKRDVNSVLFGTDSFWTGVDVPGEALSQVIVTKLPFAVPSHPLIAARIDRIRQQGKSPFGEYNLPEAVLKFRQGIGRLIRRRTDHGIITCLDPRLLTKSYGRAFLESIPYPLEIIG